VAARNEPTIQDLSPWQTLFTRYTYLVIPLAFYALGSLVCVVQALIFTILSITHVRMASAGH